MNGLSMKQITVRVGVLMAVLIVLFFGARAVTQKDAARIRATPAPEQSEAAKESAWIAEMQLRVKSRLKDPDSAQFRATRFSRSSGAPVVCGEVNSKNGFGGKTGFQRFVASGNIIALEEQMAAGEMDKTWQAVCR